MKGTGLGEVTGRRKFCTLRFVSHELPIPNIMQLFWCEDNSP